MACYYVDFNDSLRGLGATKAIVSIGLGPKISIGGPNCGEVEAVRRVYFFRTSPVI